MLDYSTVSVLPKCRKTLIKKAAAYLPAKKIPLEFLIFAKNSADLDILPCPGRVSTQTFFIAPSPLLLVKR